MNLKNILVACEFSGVVREKFRELGHNACSCDLLPAEDGSPHHQQRDALLAIREPWYDGQPWNLIGIHYTCTLFCNSGVRWLYRKNPHGSGHLHERDDARWAKMRANANEFAALWCAAVETGAGVYFENPIMHSYAAMEIDRAVRALGHEWIGPPTQIIQPYDFGHPETKATGLWLHKLPKLVPTKIVRNEMALLPKKDRSRVHYASPNADRWKERSRTLPGIGAAMAAQWGNLS